VEGDGILRECIMAGLLSVAISGPADAADPAGTGNDFLQACQNAKGAQLDQCYLYVRGMHEATLFWIASFGKPPPFCMPPTATYQQGVDVVLKFLKERPEERHKHMVGIYTAAFINAFPCSASR
jgi:hypothetical protein